MKQPDLARSGHLLVQACLTAALTATLTLSGCQSRDRGPAARSNSAGTEPARTADQASALLGVSECEVLPRWIDATPGRRLTVTIPIQGQAYVIDLEPHSVRGPGYRVLVEGADGAVAARGPGPVRTLRGRVRGRPGCAVTGAMLESGLHLMVSFDDGRRCWMQPLPAPATAPRSYAVYEQQHILPTGGVCMMPGADEPDPNSGVTAPLDDASETGLVRIAQLACDTDTEFVAMQGSVEATEARINAIVNTLNLQYERQVGIRHEISTILIRTADDPYTASDAQRRLCQFIEEWTTNRTDVERDLAHLFTGANLGGSTIGIAADIGGTGLCMREGGCGGGRFGTFGSYCLSQSDFSSNFSCVTDLTAHELGHLWGAFHCDCPTNTMNPRITCTNTFSAGSIRSIIDYRDTRDCLEEDEGGMAIADD